MTEFVTVFNEKEVVVSINNSDIEVGDHMYSIIKDEIVNNSGKRVNIDDIIDLDNGIIRIELDSHTLDIRVETQLDQALQPSQEEKVIKSAMAGVISDILVDKGDMVMKNQTMMVISAMKMENKIISPIDGVVSEIHVKKQEQVKVNQLLLELGDSDN